MTGVIGTNMRERLNDRYVADTTTKLQEAQSAVMTGVKSQTYAGMASDVARATDYSNAMTKHKAFIEGGNVINGQMQYQERTLDRALRGLIAFKTELVGSNAPEMARARQLGAVTEQVKSMMDEVLNGQINDRFVFGGLRQDQSPIDTSNPQSLRDGTYYRGDESDTTMHFSGSKFDVEFGLRADHQGFKDAYRGIQMVLDNPLDQANIAQAQVFVDDAIAELSNALSNLGNQQAKIADDIQLNEEAVEMLSDFLTETLQTNNEQAAMDAQLHKMRLEASFLILQSMPRVVDFLR